MGPEIGRLPWGGRHQDTLTANAPSCQSTNKHKLPKLEFLEPISITLPKLNLWASFYFDQVDKYLVVVVVPPSHRGGDIGSILGGRAVRPKCIIDANISFAIRAEILEIYQILLVKGNTIKLDNLTTFFVLHEYISFDSFTLNNWRLSTKQLSSDNGNVLSSNLNRIFAYSSNPHF